MVNTTSYVDTKTGGVIEAKLRLTRLRPDAVPSILPNCPAYLSAIAATSSREAPQEKKARREAALLQEAVNLSIETHLEEERNNRIDTFQALLNFLPHIKVSKFWTVFTQHDCVLFLNLTFDGAPAVRKSKKITEDLSLTLFFQDVEVTKLDGIDIPKTVNDIRCLTRLLEAVEGFDEAPTLKSEDKTSGILKLVRLPALLPHHRSRQKTRPTRNNQTQVHIKALPRQRPLCAYLRPLNVLRVFDAVLVQGNLPIGIGHRNCGKECGVVGSLCDVTLIVPVHHGYINAVNRALRDLFLLSSRELINHLLLFVPGHSLSSSLEATTPFT
ncbi:hypothetical protein MRX96_026916 [Rhipicephalus microplus]